MAPALPQPGETISDKYEVVRFLGKGGMGIVVEGRHRKLDQRFAIKVLLPDALERPDAVARFEREARAAARLKSPHVVRVVDVDSDPARGGLPFLVMEYLEGHDLGTELRRRGKIPVPEAVDLALEAAVALAEAHAAGIVHRDIKPSNLFLCSESGVPVLKVMDFGISKLVSVPGETELTTTETTLGTPSYMAPEQLMSSRTIDHRVDIWALGVVLYRMLSGSLPFSADSATALAVQIATQSPTDLANIAPWVPPNLAGVVMMALERDPSKRPADAGAFARLLEPFGSGRVPLGAQLAGFVPRAVSSHDLPELSSTTLENAPTASAWHRPAAAPVSRSPLLLALALGLVAAAVGFAIFVGVKNPPEPPPVSAASAPSIPAPPPSESVAIEPTPLPPPPPTGAPSAEPASVKPIGKKTAPKATTSATSTPAATAAPTNDPLHL